MTTIRAGDTFKTNEGCVAIVIEYIHSRKVQIEFQGEGKHRMFVIAGNVRNGKVKNPCHPSVAGVGYLGVGDHKVKINGKRTKAYITWNSMIVRCYSLGYLAKCPTYKDCSVHPDWHNFQVFAAWFEGNYIEGCDLDKDKLLKGNRVYSPEACCFISHSENMILAQAKEYGFKNPEGDIVDVYNLKKFSLENNLHLSAMHQVNSGKRNSHKGWRAA